MGEGSSSPARREGGCRVLYAHRLGAQRGARAPRRLGKRAQRVAGRRARAAERRQEAGGAARRVRHAGRRRGGGAVETVTHLLDYFGARKAVLLGFDWGGGVALQYALEKPNRVSGVVFWNGSYRELDALKPLCRMRIPMACCAEPSELH